MWHAGSYFPNQGWNPCFLQWKHGVLTTGLPGKSQCSPFFFFLTFMYLLAVPAFIAASRLSLLAARGSSSLVSAPVLLISAASPVEHRLWACGPQ